MMRDVYQHREKIRRLEYKNAVPEGSVLCQKKFLPGLKPFIQPIPIDIYRPSQARFDQRMPTILHIPGTGFIARPKNYTQMICSELVYLTQFQLICIHHRLAPEYPFPCGLLDVYYVLKLLLTSPKTFNIDRDSVVLCGDSSGSTLAVTAMHCLARENISVAHQIYVSPILDFARIMSMSSTSLQYHDKILPLYFIQWFTKLYLGDKKDYSHSLISPIFDTHLPHLPKTDLICGNKDVFLRDVLEYKGSLVATRNQVRSFVFKNSGHELWWQCRKARELVACSILRTHFKHSQSCLFFKNRCSSPKWFYVVQWLLQQKRTWDEKNTQKENKKRKLSYLQISQTKQKILRNEMCY